MTADVRAETLADKRLYTEAGLESVSCAACGARVGVRKSSRQHTSIQWTPAASGACLEFAAGAGERCGGLPLGCASLRASIDAAVVAGWLTVPDA